MLVLASSSPRRQELLRNAGFEFRVQAAGIVEQPSEGEMPEDYARRLAHEKALAVWSNNSSELVLGADTVVVVDGTILEKPKDADDARRMLCLLSGRRHEVITGVSLVGGEKYSSQGLTPASQDTGSERTLVTMDKISEQEIADYVADGEPMDKAGAYAIQGVASRWIAHIEGDYFNVVGLPISLVYRMLREHQAREGNSA